MSRQDANAAFALSSFLQGTNAAYIDDLYARYEQDPGSVDAEVRFRVGPARPPEAQPPSGVGGERADPVGQRGD